MTPEDSRHTSAGHGTSAPDACSVLFEQRAVSAYGTAAQAGFWLALEQTGPWGRHAATDSHLPAPLGQQLDHACASRGGRLALLRAPGPHADAHHPQGRAAYVAFSGAEPWLLSVASASLEDLVGIDFDALAAGDRTAVEASLPAAVGADPVLLVCTNGRRDVCCAIRGRPLALEAAEAGPGRVWESSHTGGHRFAPTGVLLPFGVALARLDGQLCADVLSASLVGRLPLRAMGPLHDRGRSALAPAAQAAESWVRAQHGITELTALATMLTGDAGSCVVRHGDGRSWRLRVEAGMTDPGLPESCGKSAVPLAQWQVRES